MRREKLGPYVLGPDGENVGIYTGDARELALAIPDESVDLIFTDPIYQNIDDYRWLAETAARVLKPDSACLTFAGIGFLPETHDAMRTGNLSYRWRLVVRPLFGYGSGQWHGKLQAGTKEIIWYEKGRSKVHNAIFDILTVRHGEYGRRLVNGSVWGKAQSVAWWYVNAFSVTDMIIVDFFCGEGGILAACKMLARRWLAFEIDSVIADLARQRVRETQAPLPGLAEQVRQAQFELVA